MGNYKEIKQEILALVVSNFIELEPESKVFLARFIVCYPELLAQDCVKDMVKKIGMNDRVISRSLTNLVDSRILTSYQVIQGRGRPRTKYSVSKVFKTKLEPTLKLKDERYFSIVTLVLGINLKKNIDLKDNLKLTVSESLLLAVLFVHAEQGGVVQNLSIKVLIQLTGMTKRRILSHIKKLKTLGYLHEAILDFSGNSFFKEPSGLYNLNLSHPTYGIHKIPQRHVILIKSFVSISESEKLLNLIKNSGSLDLNRRWPINLEKEYLGMQFYYLLNYLQKEVIQLITKKDSNEKLVIDESISAVFNRINHEGFKAYLQGKLEKYALLWLKHTNLIFKSISGFAGSASIASFIKEAIELDIDEKYLEDSKIHKDKIIDILSLLSLALSANLYMAISKFAHSQSLGGKVWSTNFLIKNKFEHEEASLILTYTRASLAHLNFEFENNPSPNYVVPLIIETNHQGQSRFMFDGELTKRFKIMPLQEQHQYGLLPSSFTSN